MAGVANSQGGEGRGRSRIWLLPGGISAGRVRAGSRRKGAFPPEHRDRSRRQPREGGPWAGAGRGRAPCGGAERGSGSGPGSVAAARAAVSARHAMSALNWKPFVYGGLASIVAEFGEARGPRGTGTGRDRCVYRRALRPPSPLSPQARSPWTSPRRGCRCRGRARTRGSARFGTGECSTRSSASAARRADGPCTRGEHRYPHPPALAPPSPPAPELPVPVLGSLFGRSIPVLAWSPPPARPGFPLPIPGRLPHLRISPCLPRFSPAHPRSPPRSLFPAPHGLQGAGTPGIPP